MIRTESVSESERRKGNEKETATIEGMRGREADRDQNLRKIQGQGLQIKAGIINVNRLLLLMSAIAKIGEITTKAITLLMTKTHSVGPTLMEVVPA